MSFIAVRAHADLLLGALLCEHDMLWLGPTSDCAQARCELVDAGFVDEDTNHLTDLGEVAHWALTLATLLI
jgi:hypothetical protein